jgi:hypothetical protein
MAPTESEVCGTHHAAHTRLSPASVVTSQRRASSPEMPRRKRPK